MFNVHFVYLGGINFKYRLIGFGPEVYCAKTTGMISFITDNVESTIVKSSFDTPASISFKVDTLSDAANPIFNTPCYRLKIFED